ncbi:hypothetical protein E3P91_01738 [Wallemia ichthyophaga]|nr:hypothetical protein E3P91_01738 [Wallemia ichthyophaga]TIB63610.1 hypothetical protein E3P78_01665 [Wallemia ichthyophaga]
MDDTKYVFNQIPSIDDTIRAIKDLKIYNKLFNDILIITALFGFSFLLSLHILKHYTNFDNSTHAHAHADFYKPLIRAPILLCAGFGCLALSIQDAPFESQVGLVINTFIYSAATTYLDSCIALFNRTNHTGSIRQQLTNVIISILSLLTIVLTYYDQRLWSLVIFLLGYNVIKSSSYEPDEWLQSYAMCTLLPLIPNTWSKSTIFAITVSLTVISVSRRWYNEQHGREFFKSVEFVHPIMCCMTLEGNVTQAIYCSMMFVSVALMLRPTGNPEKIGWNDVFVALQIFTLTQYTVAMGVDFEHLFSLLALSFRDLRIGQKFVVAGYLIQYGIFFIIPVFGLMFLLDKFDAPNFAIFLMHMVFASMAMLLILLGGLICNPQSETAELSLKVPLQAAISYNLIAPVSFYCSSLISRQLKRKKTARKDKSRLVPVPGVKPRQGN